MFQIANYGIGGHYDPHFDHARKEETKSFEALGTGNRIATMLFYVSWGDILLNQWEIWLKNEYLSRCPSPSSAELPYSPTPSQLSCRIR